MKFLIKSFDSITVFDASAKLPSGILNGNLNQFGDFDQCLNVISRNGKFKGQHCLATVQFTPPEDEEFMNQLRTLVLSYEPYISKFEDVSKILSSNLLKTFHLKIHRPSIFFQNLLKSIGPCAFHHHVSTMKLQTLC